MDNSIKDDIELTKDVLRGSDWTTDHNRIYFSTNERISDILDNFDIQDKKVLTVLGSGDQAFHFYLRGAKYVDLFDNNKLTIYYYYLRRWTIIHLKKSYPPANINSDFLRNLLSKVLPTTDGEKIAFNYWKEVANIFDTSRLNPYNLFNYTRVNFDETIYDNTNLADLLNKDVVCFSNIDIAQRLRTNKKYDIIYTSNISDCVDMTGSFENYRKNLNSLLKKDGVIICSDVCWGAHDEVEELEQDFNFHDITITNGVDCEKQIGHYYTKKRLKERFTR